MGSERRSRNGLLIIRFGIICLSIVPVAIVSGWCTWPFLLVWAVGGGIRLRYGDWGAARDCGVFGLISIWVLREEMLGEIGKSWEVFGTWLRMGGTIGRNILIGTLLLAVLGGFLIQRRNKRNAVDTRSKGSPDGTTRWNLKHPKALIFPCRTTHARIFPKRHAFDYSYLLCGFPIIPESITAGGEDVADESARSLGRWWLRIKAEDYLERGHGALGFYAKLKSYLREHDVQDADWSYAYLVTAPRFFGYSFNPVSFWYIYDRDHELKKMILEVSNTFGEKRMYLLDGSSSPSPSHTPANPEAKNPRFTDIWMKDFHVSPFNSRKGSYALKAIDPFSCASFADPKIDNTITLRSSKDHGKIVARVFTTGTPIEPDSMGIVGTLRFIGSWWWVGLLTFPRIVREAFKLYFKRSLHVWFRPEVLAESIGRAPTPTEEALQSIFQDYLHHLVHQSSEAIEINYETAIPNRPRQKITSKKADSGRTLKSLHLRVSTPAFYSRFVHYAHTSEALDRECLFTDEKNRTLWISHPDLLSYLLPKSPTKSLNESRPSTERSVLDELRWTLLRKLRCPPPEPAYLVTPKSTECDVEDIRTLPFSDLDSFVRGIGEERYGGLYRRLVTKIFLAQRFGFGFAEVVDVGDFVLRAMLCWVGLMKLTSLAQCQGGSGSVVQTGLLKTVGVEWWWMSSLAVYVCGCHIYEISKGYR